MSSILRMFAVALGAVLISVCASAQSPEITAWLIPAEDTSPNNMARGEQLMARIAAFNKSLEGSGVTVLNTVDPVLTMQLLSWNPAFVVPNGALVLSQHHTLEALKRFASREKVRVRVRFITWDEAFGLLSSLNPGSRSPAYPDVVQVGSTWVAYLASGGLLETRPGWQQDLGGWRSAGGRQAAVLPYITDVRLLFYWKRSPSAVSGSPPLGMNSSSWESIIASIRNGGTEGDTLALPIGLTLNLLHDYSPLVWAGLGELVVNDWWGSRIDLTSKRALAVPSLLSREALIEAQPGRPRRLVAFPESTPEDAARIFVNGGYRAILEPANFIDRWIEDFDTRVIDEQLNRLRIAADNESISRLIKLCRAVRPGVTAQDIADVIASHSVSTHGAISPTEDLFESVSIALSKPRTQTGSTARASATVRSFWDYAAVAVPPVTFKGGSDLVVLSGSRISTKAFALADFLASDDQFTRVLAEAGHLPSGRAGYGTDILLGAVAGQSPSAEAEFIRSVQRAIDQGRSYPAIASWPNAVENRQVLEALQNVWRRIAEHDTAGMTRAASEAEWIINARMNWLFSFLDAIRRAWLLVIGLLLATGAVIIFFIARGIRTQRNLIAAERDLLESGKRVLELDRQKVEADLKRLETERSRVLLLHLHRAYRHDASKFLGENFFQIATAALDEHWSADRIVDAVKSLSGHFRQRLVPHIEEIVEGQFEEMFGQGTSLTLTQIVEKAYDGASFIFEAKHRIPPPRIRFVRDVLSGWRMDLYPHALLVALEEWFLNSITHIHGRALKDPAIMISTNNKRELIIQSSGLMGEDERAILMENPQDSELARIRKGLPLIRNILFYAYGSKLAISQDEKEYVIILRLPLPLVAAAAVA